MDSLTVYIDKAETCTNILRYNTCMSGYPGYRKWTKIEPGTSLRPWTDGHRRYQRGGKGGRDYIVKFPHPMHFLPSSG